MTIKEKRAQATGEVDFPGLVAAELEEERKAREGISKGIDRRLAVKGMAAGVAAFALGGVAEAAKPTYVTYPKVSEGSSAICRHAGFELIEYFFPHPGDRIRCESGYSRAMIELPLGTELYRGSKLVEKVGLLDQEYGTERRNIEGLTAVLPQVIPGVYQLKLPPGWVLEFKVERGQKERVIGAKTQYPHKAFIEVIPPEEDKAAVEAEQRKRVIDAKIRRLDGGIQRVQEDWAGKMGERWVKQAGEEQAKQLGREWVRKNIRMWTDRDGAAYVAFGKDTGVAKDERRVRIAPETSLEIQVQNDLGEWVKAPLPVDPEYRRTNIEMGYTFLNWIKDASSIPRYKDEYSPHDLGRSAFSPELLSLRTPTKPPEPRGVTREEQARRYADELRRSRARAAKEGERLGSHK